MNRNIALSFAAGLLLFGLLGAACRGDEVTVATEQAQNLGIAVTGEGKASGPPDVVVLTLGVSVLAPTVKEARDQATDAMSKVVDSLKSNGVEDKDIQTSQFSIYPEYDYREGEDTLRGYRLTNVATAKLRDIDRTGEALDEAVAAGGDLTNVQGISFTIDDPDELRDQAREEAVADAKAKAERLAELSGVGLGKVISISESFGAPPPIPLARDAIAESGEGATPIEPGELDVVLTVEVVYAID
ncbi:MAG: SIMPL domain-containing protein [Dehalococcoidia bacterium]|nr:SIMPL domain-containing protein [Dehalococcoidia bacterium]